MHIFITRFSAALLHYLKKLVSRARIGSISKWPMYREW